MTQSHYHTKPFVIDLFNKGAHIQKHPPNVVFWTHGPEIDQHWVDVAVWENSSP